MDYRAYLLDAADHIRKVEIITAEDDRDALAKASILAATGCVEVWDKARRLARIDRLCVEQNTVAAAARQP